jgi:hypothetical protein
VKLNTFSLLAKRYWLALYWLLFAGVTADWAGRSALWTQHIAFPPYPWRAVIFIWAVLALEIGILHLCIYHRGRQGWSLRHRVGRALIYTFLLSVFHILVFATDRIRIYYVIDIFAVVTFLGLLIVSIGIRFRRSRRIEG